MGPLSYSTVAGPPSVPPEPAWIIWNWATIGADVMLSTSYGSVATQTFEQPGSGGPGQSDAPSHRGFALRSS